MYLKSKTLITQFLYLFLLTSAASLFFPVTADAAEGTIQFGSESYEWMTGDICPIGFYISSSAPISRYAVWLEYDSSMLTYLNGADRVEGNRIYLEGSGRNAVYKRMLHFEPVKGGETSLKVSSAAAVGIVNGADGSLYEEPVTVSSIHSSPIHILERSTKLTSLSAENTEGLETFDAETTRYYLHVKNDVTKLNLSYETEDENAVVTVSDLNLLEGKNTITLTISNAGAEDTVYTLEVEREAAEKDALGVTANDKGNTTDNSQNKDNALSDKDSAKNTLSGDENTMESAAMSDGTKTDNDERSNKRKQAAVHLDLSLLIGIILVILLTILYGLSRLLEVNRKRSLAVLSEETPEQEACKHPHAVVDEKLKMINLDQTVIDVRNVTMNFKIAQDESSSLKEYMIRSLKHQNHYRILTALKNISFEVNQGEVLGIIGTNGSGKSTLLKLISGALHPTSGEIAVDTSKVQMLTLGTGFDMELTARENVYLNGAIIGYTKEYIDEKYDEIVAFAELEGFMDERMKNFSSGMVSRLGFAIATMRDTPDILILDEVLSVGDMFFRKKSEKRIREMINSGSTVLIVSHSAGVIQKNCDRAVWIEKGVLQMIGKPDEVCKAYEQMKAG